MPLISVLIFLTACSQILVNIASTLRVKNLVDYLVYYGALAKFVTRVNPYVFLYGQGVDRVPFNYPPSSLIVLSSLHLLPVKAGEAVLILLSFFFLILSLWLVIKLSRIKISQSLFLLTSAFFIQTFPVKFTLILGQVNLIVLGLTITAIYFYIVRHRKCAWSLAVIFLSLASCLKIFPLILLSLSLLKKDYKFVFSVLGLFLILNLIPGQALFKQYFLNLVPSLSLATATPNFYDQSIYAFFFRLTHQLDFSQLATFAVFLAFFVLALRKFKKQGLLFSASYLLALCSIGSPFSWQHHLVFSYPLILILLLQNLNKIRRSLFKLVPFLIIWAVLVFHFPNEASPLLANPFLASYQTIIILGLLIYSTLKPTS